MLFFAGDGAYWRYVIHIVRSHVVKISDFMVIMMLISLEKDGCI